VFSHTLYIPGEVSQGAKIGDHVQLQGVDFR